MVKTDAGVGLGAGDGFPSVTGDASLMATVKSKGAEAAKLSRDPITGRIRRTELRPVSARANVSCMSAERPIEYEPSLRFREFLFVGVFIISNFVLERNAD